MEVSVKQVSVHNFTLPGTVPWRLRRLFAEWANAHGKISVPALVPEAMFRIQLVQCRREAMLPQSIVAFYSKPLEINLYTPILRKVQRMLQEDSLAPPVREDRVGLDLEGLRSRFARSHGRDHDVVQGQRLFETMVGLGKKGWASIEVAGFRVITLQPFTRTELLRQQFVLPKQITQALFSKESLNVEFGIMFQRAVEACFGAEESPDLELRSDDVTVTHAFTAESIGLDHSQTNDAARGCKQFGCESCDSGSTRRMACSPFIPVLNRCYQAEPPLLWRCQSGTGHAKPGSTSPANEVDNGFVTQIVVEDTVFEDEFADGGNRREHLESSGSNTGHSADSVPVHATFEIVSFTQMGLRPGID